MLGRNAVCLPLVWLMVDIFMVVFVLPVLCFRQIYLRHQDILVTKSFTYCTNTTSVLDLDGHAKKLYRIGLPSVHKMDGFIASIVLKVNACMMPNSWQSRRIRIIYYYAGVRQFADWSKTAVMHVPLRSSSVARIPLCMHASLHIV